MELSGASSEPGNPGIGLQRVILALIAHRYCRSTSQKRLFNSRRAAQLLRLMKPDNLRDAGPRDSLCGHFFYPIHLSVATRRELGNPLLGRLSISERNDQKLVTVVVEAPDLESAIL